MNPAQMLPPWAAFFTLTGTAAASLTGLMFVVISIVMGNRRPATGDPETAIGVYSTPAIVYFSFALLVSAIFVAPWPRIAIPAAAVVLIALWGCAYQFGNMKRMGRMISYTADREDWFWYNIFPFLGYGASLAGGMMLVLAPAASLYVVGVSILAMIFIGIRNAWDIVTFVTGSSHDS